MVKRQRVGREKGFDDFWRNVLSLYQLEHTLKIAELAHATLSIRMTGVRALFVREWPPLRDSSLDSLGRFSLRDGGEAVSCRARWKLVTGPRQAPHLVVPCVVETAESVEEKHE